jgi:thiol-disulfide isomerase/thioredoxin
MTGLVVLVITLAVALAGGALWKARSGRLRQGSSAAAARQLSVRERLEPALGEQLPDAPVTLLQFSSAFCAPCRATRAMLAQLADGEQVVHVEVDATQLVDRGRADVLDQLRIRRTPTVLFLRADGTEEARAVGLPRRADVTAVIQEITQSEQSRPNANRALG